MQEKDTPFYKLSLKFTLLVPKVYKYYKPLLVLKVIVPWCYWRGLYNYQHHKSFLLLLHIILHIVLIELLRAIEVVMHIYPLNNAYDLDI